MTARQSTGILNDVSASAVLVGALTTLALTPSARWLTGALGYRQFNLISPTRYDLQSWLVLILFSTITVGIGAYVSSYVSRPQTGRLGVLQGFLVWTGISTARWILATFNLTIGARAGQSSSSLVMWIAFVASLTGAMVAMYCGWLGAGTTSPSFFKRTHKSSKAGMRPAPQH